MKITFKKGLLAAIAALTVCSARADEGMWLLQLMKQQNSIDMMKRRKIWIPYPQTISKKVRRTLQVTIKFHTKP